MTSISREEIPLIKITFSALWKLWAGSAVTDCSLGFQFSSRMLNWNATFIYSVHLLLETTEIWEFGKLNLIYTPLLILIHSVYVLYVSCKHCACWGKSYRDLRVKSVHSATTLNLLLAPHSFGLFPCGRWAWSCCFYFICYCQNKWRSLPRSPCAILWLSQDCYALAR